MAFSTIKKKTKATWSRIVLNRTTAAFFVFSFVLCFTHGVIQSLFFSVDSEYRDLLHDIIETVNSQALQNITEIPSQVYTDHIILRVCDDVPTNAQRREQSCFVALDTDDPVSPLTNQATITMNQIAFDHAQNTSTILDNAGQTRAIQPSCAQTLLYAHQNIRFFSSEDIAFIILQFWLLASSTLVVTTDSVPHLWTVIMTRGLMTAWSIYSVWRTQSFDVIFRKLYANPGTPCSIDFFPSYFRTRTAYEIPNLVLNVIGFAITCWLSLSLLRIYNAQAMGYIGAPKHITRINRLFLAVLSCLQLEVYILITAMALWIDVLCNTAIKNLSDHTELYLSAFITTSIVLIPWISLGWYSIKREMKKTILVFFFLAFAIILGWTLMFYSMVYRWTFLQWPFLAGCSIASFFLIVSSTILAIICCMNFDRGLKQYLEAEAVLAKSGFAPDSFSHDEEKSAAIVMKELSPYSPTTPTEKFGYPIPTYLTQPQPHSQPGSLDANATEGQQANALGASLRVQRFAEGQVGKVSVEAPQRHGVKFGEPF